MNTPNLVYKSLDVGTRYFFYNYKFRDRDDVGACCNSAIGACYNMWEMWKLSSDTFKQQCFPLSWSPNADVIQWGGG